MVEGSDEVLSGPSDTGVVPEAGPSRPSMVETRLPEIVDSDGYEWAQESMAPEPSEPGSAVDFGDMASDAE